MRTWSFWLARAAPLLLATCSSSPQSTGPTPPSPPDLPPATGITFTDLDPTKGAIEGTIAIGHAADESDITEYRVYWAAADGTRIAGLAKLPKTGADLRVAIPPGSGVVPAATRFVVLTANATREAVAGVSATPIDNYAQFVDISAGLTTFSASVDPSPVVDVANGKLLVVANDSYDNVTPTLLRCNLEDLAVCVYPTTPAPMNSGLQPSAVLDVANAKLLAVTQGPGLFRCNLDGSGCAFLDVAAGRPHGAGINPSAALDAANGKLLVAVDDTSNGDVVAFFRCNVDGTGCTYTDISTGQPAQSGLRPSLVVDAAGGKALVVTRNYANQGSPSLYRCNLDGSACTHTDISHGAADSGDNPSAVIDAANGRLLVVTEDRSNGYRSTLFRCALDGTACTRSDISAGQPPQTGWFPSAVVDAVHAKLWVVTQDGGDHRLSLFRCELDGTLCTHTDISAGQTDPRYPHAVIDAAHGKLLVVASMLNARTGLFTIGLW